jgi:hypothetical protein
LAYQAPVSPGLFPSRRDVSSSSALVAQFSEHREVFALQHQLNI